MFITLQYLYVEDLTPNVIVLNLEMGTLGSNSKKRRMKERRLYRLDIKSTSQSPKTISMIS